MLTADERKIVESHRIPLDTAWPGTYWMVSLDEDSLMPTELEMKQIRSYCESMILGYYNEYYGKRLLDMPFAKDGGHNTTIFRKFDTGWRWRKMTWTQGYAPLDHEPLTLVQVMDRERGTRAKWEEWKQSHAELF